VTTSGARIDVEKVVAELQARVARGRQDGDDDAAIRGPQLTLGQDRIVLRPELTASTRRVVGVPLSLVRRALMRVQFQFLDDLVGQVNRAIDRERTAREGETGDREALALRVQSHEAELDAIRASLAEIERRLAEIGPRIATLDEIEALDVIGRLARIERDGRSAAGEAEIRPILPEVAALALDRGRIDDGGASRLNACVAHLGTRGPILVAGLGDGGQLLRALHDAGADAIGVDPNEVNVVACQDQALRATMADPLRHLAAQEAGSLGGLVVAGGAADRFDGNHWLVFADLAASRLRAGAGLVVEMLNVASPAALALRMRDPTLPAPVHVDTVAFLLRVAGVRDADVRTFGAFRDIETLPLEFESIGPAEIERVSEFVNRFLIGQPLAAVFARR
jgi:hypothetical protein